jgi:PPOX class probable F420-dependent enzyme
MPGFSETGILPTPVQCSILAAMFNSNPRARQRLDDEAIIWFTTVRPSGQPQTSAVWFLRDGDEFLIYSLADTARVGNIAANPKVSLNLDGNGQGGDVVTIEGIARIDPEAPPADEVDAYVAKYRGYMQRNGWTPEVFAAKYPVAIRVTATRGRAW